MMNDAINQRLFMRIWQKNIITFKPGKLFWSVPHFEELAQAGIPLNRGMVRHGGLEKMKDYVGRGPKLTYAEHVQEYLKLMADPEGKIPRSVIVFGTRNIFQNLLLVGYSSQHPSRLLYRHQDEPINDWTYQGLCCFRDGSLSMEVMRFHPERADAAMIEFVGGAVGREGEVEFIITGQPLVWDGIITPMELLAAILYDLRHIFHLLWEDRERRLHPDYEWHKEAHEELMQILMSSLDISLEDRADKITTAARKWGLSYETGYLMSAIGLKSDGTVCLVKQHGRMDQLGVELKRLGCTRGILNHQGGSVGLCYWSKRRWIDHGWINSESQLLQPVTIGSGSYFRPQGHAVIIAELEEDAIDDPFQPTSTNLTAWGLNRSYHGFDQA